MSAELAVGTYRGTIVGTRVLANANDQETVEIGVQLEGHQTPTTVRLALFGGAQSISVQTINKLGYKGTLQQLADNTSSLNGQLVEVDAKESKTLKRDGTPYVNLNIRVPRAMPVSKVRDFKFGEESAPEVPAGW
jgi:hypothetical protein